MIKAVVFDFGNVISMQQEFSTYKKMEKLCGVPAQLFIDAFEEFRNDFDLGKIGASELYRRILAAHGYSNLAADEKLCETLGKIDLDDWNRLNDESHDWALSLHAAGFKLGILSNMPTDFLTLHRDEIPIFNKADSAVFSCNVRIIKPDERIYRISLDELGVSPEEAVFFDDLQANIDAARKIGMKGIVWHDLTQAKREFAELLAKTNH